MFHFPTQRLKFILLLLCFLSLLSACYVNRDRKQVESILKDLVGRQIIFPEDATFVKFGRDTVESPLALNAPYKILTYVDSIGCTGCKMGLGGWSQFKAELDSLTSRTIPILFFVNTNDTSRFRYSLISQGFDYPICVDTKDELNELNFLPTAPEYQTFLLDKENRIVLVGNPTYSKYLKNIYFRVITGDEFKAAKEIELYPQILHIDNLTLDKPVEKYVTIRNTSLNVVRVTDIYCSCECIAVELESDEIVPSSNIRMYVRFAPESQNISLGEIVLTLDNGQKEIISIRRTFNS